ncbi:DNA translocase FtsK [Mycoplana rhizolycopersici]|uniref:DNA translocase FtsK n=1 Tax=Mycoplana rhizolycopersici TaxID=2746702 RepID=A0ABX2QDP4_9HYPH|nr:DNA translocase FtsK [Rhizobium rhizolycopersici]NVP55288.1 DNA translocase FtsK [Rhizobium rhizolycopersici]
MTVTGEVKADAALPAWQSAFILGPNVRFTRTPESAYSRKQAEPVSPKQEEANEIVEVQVQPEMPIVEEAPVVPVPAAPAEARVDIDGDAMRRIEGAGQREASAANGRTAAARSVPPERGSDDNAGALALYLRLKREMAQASHEQVRIAVPEKAPMQTVGPADATPALVAAAASAHHAFGLHISDHALFETMSLDVDLSPLAAAERLTLPTFRAAANTTPSLYREVSIRGRNGNVVPVADAGIQVAEKAGRHAPSVPGVRDTPNSRPIARPETVAAAKSPAQAAVAPAPTRSVAEQQPATVATQEGTVTLPGYTPLSALPSLAAFRLGTVWPTSVSTISIGDHPPVVDVQPAEAVAAEDVPAALPAEPAVPAVVEAAPKPVSTISRSLARSGLFAAVDSNPDYEFPPVDLLQQPTGEQAHTMTQEALEQSAGLLESILEDFGVKGEIIDVRPGPVVTLYEFEPAPGVKSSRVIGLADDIARSMSALSARVAVVPGRNVIGIELPNAVRETVYFRELIECESYWETKFKLAVCLGKTIGGEPVIAELAKMPHLLVAGTTGSGKSVAINTMILSLLYRLKPEECRLIMVDPKMLELSVYDGIPHLLTPVVTDPKKAVMALKWAVREMEDRYRKMSRLGVRNIDGFNARAAAARAKGETVMCDVQKGFDRSTGEPLYEQEEMDLTPMPYIVVIVDEMADLMMVAGKEIEGAIQRLAQMARAAGIHLIMATQRPSVDVITGTIKANFPTRISFQVTSKIDSRTILGEQGAEHLLGQGDMLHMIGGGRIARVHGPFVSDSEVEAVVAHLKTQGRPEYLGTVTEDAEEEDAAEPEDTAVFDKTAMAEDDGNDLYEKAIKVVQRDRKCSTSYIQRRLSIGYNRAASLVERMERDGLVGPANHVGKREILSGSGSRDSAAPMEMVDDED